MAEENSPSNVVAGFQLNNCIASGASTQVWEVTEQGGSAPFAMKLLLDEALADSEQKAVLKREFKVGKTFEHPNIIRFHNIEVNRDHGFFLMDYFRAPSLKAHLSAGLPGLQSRFNRVAEAVCLGLSYIHEKGWLHRDIKPENILVSKAGEVRIIDFSLAAKESKGLGRMLKGKTKAIQGTRTYIAPETLLKKQPTVQTDIYSLGVTFFEMLTGHPPFTGTSPADLLKKHVGSVPVNPSSLNPNIKPEVDLLILKMLEKKPEKRHEDVKQLYAAIRSMNFFHEDPLELDEKRRKEAELAAKVSVDKRLDSRADHSRTEAGLASPVKHKKKKRKLPPDLQRLIDKEKAAKAAEAPATPAAPMPGTPGYPMQPMPMQPMPMQQMPMPMPMYPQPMPPAYPAPPQYPQPGYPMQQPPMPGQQMPPQAPQQMPAPQPPMPQAPPPQQPPAPVPPQQAVPPAPPAAQPVPQPQPPAPPQQPAPPAPAAQQPAPPAPPQPAPPSQPAADEINLLKLDEWNELPDFE